MIFDIIVIVILLAAMKTGFHEGLIHSLASMIGYVAGAIGGLYLALQYNKSAWVIAAIFIGAGLGSFAGKMIAKALKITIIRGPLAWINGVAGAAFQAVTIAVVAFLVGTALLWAPWPTGQNAVAESKVYTKLNAYMPHFLSTTFSTITKKFEE